MKIAVAEYDVAWKQAFEAESQSVQEALGEVVARIHHIGSTSVPGIVATPVIDIMLEVESLAALDEREAALQALGYESLGERGAPGRRFYRKQARRDTPTHLIHAFEADSPHVERHLAFRDYLIANPAIGLEYGELKKRLADQHPSDSQAYVAGKHPFIQQTERDALEWRRRKQPRARGH